jgi:hypothetical protein
MSCDPTIPAKPLTETERATLRLSFEGSGEFRKPGWAQRAVTRAIYDLPRLRTVRPADEAGQPVAVDRREDHATAGGPSNA